MTEPTKLMPCAFCGGNARKVKHSAGSPGTTGYDRWYGVACAGCNACVGARDRRFRTSAAAIAAWNTRTPQPTQAQAGAVPMSREEIDAVMRKSVGYGLSPSRDDLELVRAVERHHGITGGQHG